MCELGELMYLELRRKGITCGYDKFAHDFVHDPRGSGLSAFVMFEETPQNRESINNFRATKRPPDDERRRPDHIVYTHNTLCFAFDRYYVPFKFIKCIPSEGSIFFMSTDQEIADALRAEAPVDCFGLLSVPYLPALTNDTWFADAFCEVDPAAQLCDLSVGVLREG